MDFNSKKSSVVTSIIFVCIFIGTLPITAVRAETTDEIRVIIIFDGVTPAAGIAQVTEKIGLFYVKYEYPNLPGIAATLTGGQIKALDKIPFVKGVEYDEKIVHIMLGSATVWFGVDNAVYDFDVDGDLDGLTTENGWPIYTENDIVIAIIDTGIDVTHFDLDEGKVIGWVDFVNGKLEPYDDHGHGTHVSSIAAGTGEGNSVYTGVAPGAALVGVKVIAKTGSGTISDVNAGIQWVINNKEKFGIEVLSMSIGISGSSDGTDSTSTLVNKAVENGIITVVAAGNEGPKKYSIGSPAAAENAITVGAMADVGELGFYLASFSSRGPTADERIKPDVVGPGVSLTAAEAGSTNGYVSKSGTSMSTPFVSGTVALMLHANTGLIDNHPNDIKSIIMSTAVDWGSSWDNTGKDIDYGAGRLDSYEAVKTAGNFVGTGPVVPAHEYKEDSLGGKGESDLWPYEVTDTNYPIAITLIIPDWKVVTPVKTDPDFDLYLYDPNGNKIASSLGVRRQETISVSITKLGTYTVEVYSYSGSGNYFFDISAGLGIEPPGQPALYSPADGTITNDNTPRFEWIKGSNAENHRLVVDNDPNFADGENVIDVTLITENYYDVPLPGLAPDNYWWKVCAYNAAGDNWSENTWVLEIIPAPPAQWNLIETWAGTVEAPAAWQVVETWTGTIQASAAWQVVETWTGTVSAPAQWSLIETWTGTVNAPAQWQAIETWTGTIKAPVMWRLIETWTGTVQAPAEWQLIETWTGTVEAPAAWQIVEGWTGTVEAPAAWQLIETWTGTIEAPIAEWQLIETWTGTVEAPAAWQVIEAWTGTVEATMPKLHIASIDMSKETIYRGPNAWTNAIATVTIVDADNNPVEGAKVYGHWGGLRSGDVSGVTDVNGRVTFETKYVKNASGEFTFTVDNVVLEGWIYDLEANEETSDSIEV